MEDSIFLDAPNVGELEKKYLNQTIDSGFVSSVGPNIDQFQDRFAQFLNVENAIGVQSGTAALHVALHGLGISNDDEVIVPALTFIASVNPIVYVGAKPVFVDIDPETWTIDPQKIEEAITEKTKAIIVVHLYGNPCKMDAILNIAQKHNLYVIEDATESLGAFYQEKASGTMGEFGCFSFNGNKMMTTGGGGMVVSRQKERSDYVHFLVNQAKDKERGYYHPEIGFNYRMTSIEAAMGLAQLDRLDKFLNQKKRFSEIYHQELESFPDVEFQKEYDSSSSAWWLTSIKINRDVPIETVQSELKNRGIPTRRVFMPIVEFPPYQDSRTNDFVQSYEIYQRSLNLPSSTLNSEESILKVCRALKEVLS